MDYNIWTELAKFLGNHLKFLYLVKTLKPLFGTEAKFHRLQTDQLKFEIVWRIQKRWEMPTNLGLVSTTNLKRIELWWLYKRFRWLFMISKQCLFTRFLNLNPLEFNSRRFCQFKFNKVFCSNPNYLLHIFEGNKDLSIWKKSKICFHFILFLHSRFPIVQINKFQKVTFHYHFIIYFVRLSTVI